MATTKEQLLQYFRDLDVSTLEKLQKYSKLLIIPDEDLLVNATMSQMVERLIVLQTLFFLNGLTEASLISENFS